MSENKIEVGRCISVNKNNWVIVINGEKIYCIINNKYMKKFLPTVGDYVFVERQQYGDIHVIVDIKKRENSIKRIVNGKEQILAANIDVVFIMSSMNEEFNIKKIEKMVMIAFNSGARIVFILTKKDLVENSSEYSHALNEKFSMYPIIEISSIHNEGLEEVKKYWNIGETAVLIGSSGVGKSTFINKLSNKKIRTKTIREKDGEGRHTTTARTLYSLKDGRFLIDEPGIRKVEISNIDNYFEEMYYFIDQLSKKCKFSDCQHNGVSGCALDKAIEDNIITKNEVESYIKNKKKSFRKKIITGQVELSKKERIKYTKKLKKRDSKNKK